MAFALPKLLLNNFLQEKRKGKLQWRAGQEAKGAEGARAILENDF